MKRILFCEVCDDGSAGGSHQALYDNVRLLDGDAFSAVVVFYEHNRFVEPLRELGATVHVWEQVRRDEKAAFSSPSIPRKVLGLIGAIRRRRRLLRAERVDLVHLNNSPAMGFDDWLPAARSLGLPCVVNVMGAPYDMPAGGLRRALVSRFDRYVSISDHVHRELLAGGYPAERIVANRIGVDTERFRARVTRGREAVRAELGVAGDTVLVTLVGNLQPWKGHDVVVTALERMDPAERERLAVLFVGAIREEDRPHVSRLEDRLRKADLEETVRFLGSRTDVPDLLAASDVQLHASTFPEPFGLVLVEGLAIGLPIVAASVGGPCEVIDADTGLLFDPAEPDELAAALRRLANDPALRARLGAAGPARARLFDASGMARRNQDLYRELLGAGAAPPASGDGPLAAGPLGGSPAGEAPRGG